jgi:hypothetical protein
VKIREEAGGRRENIADYSIFPVIFPPAFPTTF